MPSRLVTHGARTGEEVALTFDMGGRVGDAIAIVDWLVDHNVHASIFMTGAMADNPNTDAGRRVLAIVDAHSELLTLGNHSYTHRDFRDLTASQIRDELPLVVAARLRRRRRRTTRRDRFHLSLMQSLTCRPLMPSLDAPSVDAISRWFGVDLSGSTLKMTVVAGNR